MCCVPVLHFSMSKAFTRESDDAPEHGVPIRPAAEFPPGTANYLTPDGAERFRAELNKLASALETGTGETADLERRAAEHRVERLRQCLASAVIVAPQVEDDRIRCGATVAVRDSRGNEERFRIVGMDETDAERNWISWRSPLARALLGARLGDSVRVPLPDGEERFEILGQCPRPETP